MLCIRRKPDDRPELSKIRRLLHRITISFIDKQKQNIDREIEREFSSLFEDASEFMSPQSVESSPHTTKQSSGRHLAVTDDMRVEQKPATMCAVVVGVGAVVMVLSLVSLPRMLTEPSGKFSRDYRNLFPP